jgi:hypothetical protein
MRQLRHSVFALVAVALITAGRESVAQYSGDGKLIDNGPRAATDRYVLDLGPISLRASATTAFKLKGLPKKNFVLGFEIHAPQGSKLEQSAIAPVVSIVLLEDGKPKITKEGKLSEWTWSIRSPGDSAFVYGREKPGTYFDPLPRKNYELVFRVKEPDRGSANYTASLVAKSGGWK